jgi:adenine-specific DNA-methyltransferase
VRPATLDPERRSLSAILDLINQIDDQRLRDRLRREWDALARDKKFGLVFEEHLPELLPVHGSTPRRGDLVAKKDGPLNAFWRVRSVVDGIATCTKPEDR